MRRRIIIIAVSAVLSLILVVATMQMVCWFLNRIFPQKFKRPDVIWIVK